MREFLGRAFNRAVQLLVAPGIVDTQCGAKVAQTDLWREILPRCREEGFAWDVEVVAVANSLDIPVLEIAIEWRHDEGSQVRVLRDGIAMLRALPRIRRNVVRRPGDRPPGASGPETGVFDDHNAAALAGADAAHWWFRSKAALVAWTLRRWQPERRPSRRPGRRRGRRHGDARLAARPARSSWRATPSSPARPATVTASSSSAPTSVGIPLATGSASVVCLLDVLEHLPDPGEALAEARRLLRRAAGSS